MKMIARTQRGFAVRRLRKLLPLDSLLGSGRSLPADDVYLVPTLRCNLSCPYCFQRSEAGIEWHPSEPDDLTLDDWRAVIAQLRRRGPTVYVIGGELFLHRDALDLLRAVKAAHLPLCIITNGTALPALADELLAIGVDSLVVSIDGPAEVHNAVRGHPRSYQLATEGIRRILAAPVRPSVQVFCAVSHYTQSHLIDFVAAMATLGVDRIVLNHLIFATPEQIRTQASQLAELFDAPASSADALAYPDSVRVDVPALRESLETIRSGPWSHLVVSSPAGVEANLEAYYDAEARPFAAQRCSAVHREMWIMPNGDVSACVHIGEVVMGNVRDTPLAEIWNGPRYRRFRAHLADRGLFPACARCEKLTYERTEQKNTS